MSNSITKSLTLRQAPAPPSPRELEIYKRSVVYRHDQLTIAADYNLGQPRISKIIAKVRRWLAAGGAPSDPAIRDHLAQQQLSKTTQKIRLQRVIDMATYAIENRLPSQVRTKYRYQGMTEVWREENRELSPEVNLPAMRLLLRAVKDLDRLDATPDDAVQRSVGRGSPDPAPPLSESELLQSFFDFLCRLRARAEAAGHLPPSTDIPQCIAQGLSELIGTHLDSTGRLTGNIPASIPPQHHLSLSATTDLPLPSTT